MLCKPVFIIHGRVKAYNGVQKQRLKSGRGTCITILHKHEVSSLSTDK